VFSSKNYCLVSSLNQYCAEATATAAATAYKRITIMAASEDKANLIYLNSASKQNILIWKYCCSYYCLYVLLQTQQKVLNLKYPRMLSQETI